MKCRVVAGYTYLGAITPICTDYPIPRVRLDHWGGTTGTFAGLDRFGRTIDHRWVNYRSGEIDDVAGALRSGVMKPTDVPIEYIVRDGNTLILNTRSEQALQKAGIPRSQ